MWILRRRGAGHYGGSSMFASPTVKRPTDRPASLLPITLKLGEKNIPENFYVFTTLAEIQEFFAAGVQYLIDAYGYGWMQIATLTILLTWRRWQTLIMSSYAKENH